jgi:hypothetical protein
VGPLDARHFEQRFMQGTARAADGILFPTSRAAAIRRWRATSRWRRALRHAGQPLLRQRRAGWTSTACAPRCARRAQRPALRHARRQLQLRAPDGRLAGARHAASACPPGSRILDTGGYKGQSRELPPTRSTTQAWRAFGVPRERCINMYGMTELSTQLYDDGNAVVPSVKRPALGALARGRSAHGPRRAGRRARRAGALRPGNFNSATTILTEDVGVATAGGFLLLGRARRRRGQGLLAGRAGIPAGGARMTLSPWRAGHLPGLEADVQWHTLRFAAHGARRRSRCRCSAGADAALARASAAAAADAAAAAGQRIVAIVDRAIARLLDPRDPVRRQLERLLPRRDGYDAEMVRLGLTPTCRPSARRSCTASWPRTSPIPRCWTASSRR